MRDIELAEELIKRLNELIQEPKTRKDIGKASVPVLGLLNHLIGTTDRTRPTAIVCSFDSKGELLSFQLSALWQPRTKRLKHAGKPSHLVGPALRKIRREKEVTQAALAQQSGIECSRLCRAEHGYVALTESELYAIAKVLKINADLLILPVQPRRPKEVGGEWG